MGQVADHDRSLSVLLAEDNVVNQRVATALLRRIGHQVTVCDNGQQVVDAVIKGQFDLILMDIQMPVMDGLEATIAIRALPDRAKSLIPIYAISANVRDEDIDRFQHLGITDVLNKPLRPDRLKLLLDRTPPHPQSAGKPGLLDNNQIDALREALSPVKLTELFALARQSLQDSFAALERGWQEADNAKIIAASHRLTGVARNFGCLALGETAARIENEAKSGGDGRGESFLLTRLLAESLAALP